MRSGAGTATFEGFRGAGQVTWCAAELEERFREWPPFRGELLLQPEVDLDTCFSL